MQIVANDDEAGRPAIGVGLAECWATPTWRH
jgi:hypothetical protein